MAAYTRKEFLKLASLSGASLMLASCGVTNRSSSKKPSTLELIQKDNPRYDELRQGFNKRISKYPFAIAMCRSTEDVAEAIEYGRKNHLPIAVKSGGHSMEGFSSNDNGLVVNLSQMNTVELRSDQTAKAGPGCTLSHLYDELLPQQRIIPAGSCGTVGLGGLTLGGGYGLFSRKYGLTCDNLLEATIVDGNGQIHSTKNNPELLWAIRGGGAGNFGVATELIFRTHPAPVQLQAHHFKSRKLSVAKAENILGRWFAFSEQLPTSCFSAYVLNGRTLTILVTNFEANTGEVQRLLNELALHMDEYRSDDPAELAGMLKHYYGSLVPVYFKNASAGFYKDFRDIEKFIDQVLERSMRTPGMIYQVNTLGGNIANPEFEASSCYPHREFNFLSELQAYWQQPSQEENLTAVSAEIQEIFRSNGVSSQYFNYCNLDFKNWQNAYYGKNYLRLQAVKNKYDPGNFIRHPQSITV